MAKSLYEHCIEREKFHLLLQWDPERNRDVTPRDISYGSRRKIWWKCAFGHFWEAAVYARTGQNTDCPYCAGKKVLPLPMTLASAFPQLMKEYNSEKNGDLSPFELLPATHKKVWWICENGHEWQARVNSRTQGTGCPICANRFAAAGKNDLKTTHPHIAEQWDWEKNGSLTPEMVVAGSKRKVWWRCPQGHVYQAGIFGQVSGKSRCPICAGKQVVSGENDLASRFPLIASQWHPQKNGSRQPDSVTAFSNQKIWWQCECGHAYQATVAHRTSDGAGCPYCTNRQVLPGFNDLATVEPLIAAQWHTELNGLLAPQNVTAGSRKKVWWQCAEGHVWKAVIYSRTGNRKHGCPVCAGKLKESRQMRYADIMGKEETAPDASLNQNK